MYEENYSLSNSEIRAEARNQLRGRWGNAILGFLIFSLVTTILCSIPATIALFFAPFLAPILVLVVSAPMNVGLIRFFLQFKRTNEDVPYEVLFSGFQNLGTAFLTQLLVGIYTFLWSLLFIIPGIIAAFSYSQALFIVADNPNISASEAITMSKEMMSGYKFKLFCLNLSFIGWAILSVFTMYIGCLWLNPYIQLSTINFYEDLRRMRFLG